MKKIQTVLCTLFTLTAYASPNDLEAGTYYSSEFRQSAEEHGVVQISRSGTFLRIEDGSYWEISEHYAKNALQWRADDVIIITPNPYFFSYYKYAIRNLTCGTMALANLSIGPVINGPYITRQVSGINLESRQILLSDGSAWFTSDSQLSKWKERDYIIIGVTNHGSKYRNILINVALNQFIEAESY